MRDQNKRVFRAKTAGRELLGRESFSGGDKGREVIGPVESTMMRRPLRSTIGPRPRSSKGGSAGSDPAFGFQWAQKWPPIVWNSVGGPNRVLVAFRKTGMQGRHCSGSAPSLPWSIRDQSSRISTLDVFRLHGPLARPADTEDMHDVPANHKQGTVGSALPRLEEHLANFLREAIVLGGKCAGQGI